MEIVKSIVYTIIGLLIGLLILAPINVIVKVVLVIGAIMLWIMATLLFTLVLSKKPTNESNVHRDADLRTSRSQAPLRSQESAQVRSNAALASNSSAQVHSNASRIQSSSDAQLKSNPLDRKPMSAEKREEREKNKVPATKIVLLNEEGRALLEWGLQRKTCLIIGKGSEKEPVDIDLAGSAVAQMISKQHAVLNYTDKGWCVDDIDSKNGTRVKKATQNAIMDVKLVGAVEVEVGDIIYIANTMLQIQ